ncbi:MAG: XRE family transcriptional regulator, partial [Eubacterium sp.]
RFCNVLKMSSDAILYPPKTDAEDKYESIINILERCPEDKLKVAENILTLYLISHDPVEKK